MSYYRLVTDSKVGDWPKRTHYCAPSEIQETVRRAREAHLGAWREHRDLMRFLQDVFPFEFSRVQTCRMGEPFVEGAMIGKTQVRVKLSECRCVPFCPACNDTATWRRVMGTLSKFAACTPKGEEPRFIHAIQTAPIYERGSGWGVPASEDNGAFRLLVWRELKRVYGDGAGASLSYHDFGERVFLKRAPHVDFTLNGWMLKNGKVAETPGYDRPDEALDGWNKAIAHAAQKKWPEAERGNGNFFIRRPVEGVASYVKGLKYQMRELVDLKKVRYDASECAVTWVRYNDNGPTARMSADRFKVGLDEYRRRLYPWEDHSGGRPLDGRYGHLSDRSRSKTRAIMGGVEHDEECQCQRCRDWQRIPYEDSAKSPGGEFWAEVEELR